jgi:hypothetical protein
MTVSEGSVLREDLKRACENKDVWLKAKCCRGWCKVKGRRLFSRVFLKVPFPFTNQRLLVKHHVSSLEKLSIANALPLHSTLVILF